MNFSVKIRSFVWSLFWCIWNEYADLRSKSLFSIQIQENTDQKKLQVNTTPVKTIPKERLFCIINCFTLSYLKFLTSIDFKKCSIFFDTGRQCLKLDPPAYGKLSLPCTPYFQSTCELECVGTHYLVGSKTDRCIVTQNDTMKWESSFSNNIYAKGNFLSFLFCNFSPKFSSK